MNRMFDEAYLPYCPNEGYLRHDQEKQQEVIFSFNTIQYQPDLEE